MQKIQYTLSFLIFFIVFLPTTVSSQDYLMGVTGNIGLSKVTLTSSTSTSDPRQFKFAFSGNIGVFLEKKITERSSVGGEILWVQIEGLELKEDQAVISSGINRGGITEKVYQHLSYIGIPIYYRFGIGDMGIKIGVQSMVYLFQSADLEMSGELDGDAYYFKDDWEEVKYNNFDYGPKLGIDYTLNNRFRLRADFYYGVRSITPQWIGGQKKNRQISLGVGYSINSKK